MTSASSLTARLDALRKEWSFLFTRLEASGGEIYLVGGALRDLLLHPDSLPKDLDFLVTGIPFDNLLGILRPLGRAELVGAFFGVIKFTPRSLRRTVDIALPRTEVSTGQGHRDFQIAFDPALPVETDLRRRDFTVNAIACNLREGTLIDPTGGVADIAARMIRQVSPRSFPEDPLRMLRAIQFAARFDFKVAPETLKSMRFFAPHLKTVTAERIQEELTKLLALAQKPSIGWRTAIKTGLWTQILPEFHAKEGSDRLCALMDAAPPNLVVRWSVIFRHHDLSSKAVLEILGRLRFPNRTALDVLHLVDERRRFVPPETPADVRRVLHSIRPEHLDDFLLLLQAEAFDAPPVERERLTELAARFRGTLAEHPPLYLSDLALGGHDLMKELGLKPSPVLGKLLERLLGLVLEDPARNSREWLLDAAAKIAVDL